MNAVADSVMLCLQHDFYNIIFKIKHKVYIDAGWNPPPPPSEKFWVRTRQRHFPISTYAISGLNIQAGETYTHIYTNHCPITTRVKLNLHWRYKFWMTLCHVDWYIQTFRRISALSQSGCEVVQNTHPTKRESLAIPLWESCTSQDGRCFITAQRTINA
jgi:hypothetical protein